MAKKGLLNQYLLQLQHHPLRTKAITAGVLSGISDLVSQKLTGIQKIQLRRLVLKVCNYSLFPILAELANCMEKLQRDFLWSGIGEEPKFHLISPRLGIGVFDTLCWRLAKSQGFEVRGYYLSLSSTIGMLFPWKLAWLSKSGELVDHLLLHSPIAYGLWSMVWSLFGLLWYRPQRVLDLLAAWQGAFGKKCEMGFEQSILGIKSLFFYTLLDWSLFGVLYLGPFGHFLYIVLDKIFKGKRDSKTVAKKVVLEQLTSSPWNNLLFMVYYGLVIEGRPWTHVKTKIKKDYPSVQLTAWTFWPVVGWVNHQYVPLQFRVIFHSFIAFGWGIFLNLRARSMALTKAK
uniref:Peroxisomal membrane protein n=1 Tax=Quercus lobata TaxID=97700 RepID=A0A7N2R430_QUELO